jgi:hypothetical protein
MYSIPFGPISRLESWVPGKGRTRGSQASNGVTAGHGTPFAYENPWGSTACAVPQIPPASQRSTVPVRSPSPAEHLKRPPIPA